MTLLENHYNRHKEENRLETRHGQVEFRVCMKFLHDFFPHENKTDFKIADIGAGTGKYSVALAKENFDVTAVEIVPRNLKILESRHEKIKCWQGDACNLNFLPDEIFDATILFGPLYHLHEKSKKIRALREAGRITKKGGTIFVAYLLNEYSMISYCFLQNRLGALMEKGGVSADFCVHSSEEDLYDYVRIRDVDELNREADLQRIEIFSPDGPADFMRRELNAMTDETFEKFVEYQMQNALRADLIGAGSHVVDVLRKG
jgi:SAM-dependent methyltransferase